MPLSIVPFDAATVKTRAARGTGNGSRSGVDMAPYLDAIGTAMAGGGGATVVIDVAAGETSKATKKRLQNASKQMDQGGLKWIPAELPEIKFVFRRSVGLPDFPTKKERVTPTPDTDTPVEGDVPPTTRSRRQREAVPA